MDTIYWKPQLRDSNNVTCYLKCVFNVCMVGVVDVLYLSLFSILDCNLEIFFIQQPTQQEEMQGPKTWGTPGSEPRFWCDHEVPGGCCFFLWKRAMQKSTLLGTNISPFKGILKMIFLFPRWDMLVPWRVNLNHLDFWMLYVSNVRKKELRLDCFTSNWSSSSVAGLTNGCYV